MKTYKANTVIKHDGKFYYPGDRIQLKDPTRLLERGAVTLTEDAIAPPMPPPVPAPLPEPDQSLINVNACSEDDLTAINGLGPSIASAIQELRPIDDLTLLSEIPRFRDEWLALMEV